MFERRGYQLMIIPLTFWSGVEQGFFGADFTAVSIVLTIIFQFWNNIEYLGRSHDFLMF